MQHYYYLKLWTALKIQHANELCLLSAEWSRSFPHTTQGPRTFLAFTSSLHYLSVKTSLSKEVRLLLEQRSGWINGLNQQYDRNKRDTIKEWSTNLSVPEEGDLNYSTVCPYQSYVFTLARDELASKNLCVYVVIRGKQSVMIKGDWLSRQLFTWRAITVFCLVEQSMLLELPVVLLHSIFFQMKHFSLTIRMKWKDRSVPLDLRCPTRKSKQNQYFKCVVSEYVPSLLVSWAIKSLFVVL